MDKETGRNIFCATMSVEMFHQICQVIRFDSKTFPRTKKNDKFSPVRDIWEKWLEVIENYII